MLTLFFLLLVSAIICLSMALTISDRISRQGRIGWALLCTILIILMQGLVSDTIFYDHHARDAEALHICKSVLTRNIQSINNCD